MLGKMGDRDEGQAIDKVIAQDEGIEMSQWGQPCLKGGPGQTGRWE